MKTRRIGVAIQTQLLRVEHQQLYCGVRDYSREHEGFHCILAPFAASDLRAAGKSRPPYDGILAEATPALVDLAARAGVPVVDVWRDSPVTAPINCVFPDFAKAGRWVGQHLVSRGFEHFGYVVNRGVQAQANLCDDTLLGGDALGFAAYVRARVSSAPGSSHRRSCMPMRACGGAGPSRSENGFWRSPNRWDSLCRTICSAGTLPTWRRSSD